MAMVEGLVCLNLLIAPVDPKRESPLRSVYRAAADLMIGAISGKLSDEQYEALVYGTGVVSPAERATATWESAGGPWEIAGIAPIGPRQGRRGWGELPLPG